MNVLVGDCRVVMRSMTEGSIDAIVTDPPYELGFMGKAWDGTGVAYDVEVWRECLRVLKPGGHLLAFGGSRTYHRLAVAVEDAGFQIRDQIMWVYGSGFPKSHDIGKGIDKAQGHWRGKAGEVTTDNGSMSGANYERTPKGEPITDEAKLWSGWGTALKPAHEPIVLARKPLEGTVANNVSLHGVGGLNIDGCRVGGKLDGDPNRFAKTDGGWAIAELHNPPVVRSEGRWPANFIHDGSPEVLELFPDTRGSKSFKGNSTDGYGVSIPRTKQKFESQVGLAEFGSAARFFYCPKANKKDRNEGLDGFDEVRSGGMTATLDGTMLTGSGNERTTTNRNHHPTVKPTDLMRYLCRLVTPPNGLILDPFTGSGSTGKAAMLEGFRFIGIEQSAEYATIAEARITAAQAKVAG